MTAPATRPAAAATAARRPEIQVLRGVAVLAVLVFHGGLLPAGYLGVDLFFALSGFLMMEAIRRGREVHAFRLSDFYLRRAARLLPAALVTLAATTALAPFLLTPTDYAAFRADLGGALTFTANIVLFLQTDYFAAAAETKPLLHMWSLSLEEQFYLVFPLVLILAPRRLWLFAIVALILASAALAVCLGYGLLALPVSHKTMEAAAFFLLPTRAFELLIGAGAALLVARRGPLPLPIPIALAAAAAILGLLAVPLPLPHPGLAALAVCLLTALLCASRGSWLPGGALVGGLGRVGDWSYSVYLVHWPLLAYANSAYLGQTPLWVRLALLLAALPLGALQWRFVEEPFRHGWRVRPRLFGLRLASAAAACALFGLAVIGPLEKSYPQRPPPNVGLARVCDQRGARFVARADCRTRIAPRVALLGDSYAMQWAAALATDEARFGGLVQITRSGCSPALAVTAHDADPAADDCAAFMADALAAIAAAPHIEVVVVSSSWSRLLDEPAPSSGALVRAAYRESRIASAISRLVDTLQKAGKTVILLAPAPSTGLDMASCHARLEAGLPLLGGRSCAISLPQATRRDGAVYAALRRVAAAKDVAVVWPAESLCEGTLCRTALGDTLLYADRSHLTVAGATHLARSLQLADTIAGSHNLSLSPRVDH